MRKVRSASEGTSKIKRRRFKDAEIVRKMLLRFLITGGFSLAFLCQHITVAAKTQQSQSVDEIPDAIKGYCEEVGEIYDICPELLEAIAFYESRFFPDVKNNNCWGMMQINVEIHEERIRSLGYTKEEMLDPYKNLIVAADILTELFERYEDGPIVLMYYAGQQKAIPRYLKSGKITKYVTDILNRSETYERLHGK